MSSVTVASERQIVRSLPMWLPPLMGAVLYPGFILLFPWAMAGFRESGSLLLAALALVVILLASAVPVLAARALILMRHEEGHVLVRGMLYLMFALPSLFTLSVSVTRIAGVGDHVSAIWISAWLAIGATLYFRQERDQPKARTADISRVRILHGVTALVVLVGFVIAHLINHDLAAWSVQLHIDAMNSLRVWYRSVWVEPVLLALLFVMICTGVPMVAHYSRGRADVFRVIQMATGVYVGVFLCSHVLATLATRARGLETDWFFAAGPTSLLDARGLGARLIPHYFYGVLALIVHVACGLRIVLLKHGVTTRVTNSMLYGLAVIGVIVTATSMAALLGFHMR
jgi:succinate dehydrogenase/fumarate reductase cytochrome b subunit